MWLTKPLLLSAMFVAFSFSLSSTSTFADELKNAALAEQQLDASHHAQREAEFKKKELALQEQKAKLEAERTRLQTSIDHLTKTFSNNERVLLEQQKTLTLETGALGEVFGVVRQNAKIHQIDIQDSVTAWDNSQYHATVDAMVEAKALPNIEQLEILWKSYLLQIKASGEMSSGQIHYIDETGRSHEVEAKRIGTFGIVTSNGYVNWNAEKQVAQAYPVQPEFMPTLETLALAEVGLSNPLSIDPARGDLISQLDQKPTLKDRMEAGGVVGQIILIMLAIGLIIALIRGVFLMTARRKIATQLTAPFEVDNPFEVGNNPLGRVLAVYEKDKGRSVESLELRLLEAIVDEQAQLERGLSMLKLFAALAPMLGLLGTVTGMIETFQVITQYGNADPKVMAGGISTALITTVLGLVAAMPLLFAHNILSTQAEAIRQILEKQGIALVAERSEQRTMQTV
ncbi:MotA/TolQ/ExbB proton channel family protein [Vibrio sp.]|nr:MotA/TolQ/ExbB proton channel family protein [Vibrio sp.]